jgi:hypothetical protein
MAERAITNPVPVLDDDYPMSPSLFSQNTFNAFWKEQSLINIPILAIKEGNDEGYSPTAGSAYRPSAVLLWPFSLRFIEIVHGARPFDGIQRNVLTRHFLTIRRNLTLFKS